MGKQDATDAELGLEGYVMFRKVGMGVWGGGVLLYAKGNFDMVAGVATESYPDVFNSELG